MTEPQTDSGCVVPCQCSEIVSSRPSVSKCQYPHSSSILSLGDSPISHNCAQGDIAYSTVDSLSAFWPGLQVLAGDVENAIKSHMTCKFTIFLRSQANRSHNRLEYMEEVFGSTGGVGYELQRGNILSVSPKTW